MSYPTRAYPEWRSLSPKVHDADVSEFIERVAAETQGLFDDYHDIHRPERDALSYCKAGAVYTALALDTNCAELTIGEIAGLDAEKYRDLAADRGVEDAEVTPRDIALAAYANRVWRRDWAEDKTDLDPQAFIFLHDGIRDYERIGKEIWSETSDSGSKGVA